MPLQILVISDSASFAAYLERLLAETGHAVTTLLEPGQAFRAVRRQKPELIILAVGPEKVAPLAVEHRVHTPEPRAIPVIVISECLRLEAELLHIFDFIPKPLQLNRLFDDLALLARRDASRDAADEISDELCSEFSRHILRCTGLHFEQRNRAALLRGLAKRMCALRIGSYSEYLAYLKLHGEDRHELQKLLQFLTVGETYFFRYPAHFAALKERFTLPPPVDRPLRIWSAGCSTGEEPYSIAMTLMEALPDWRERDIRIIATDINNRSLKLARDGVYSPWSLRITQKQQVERYFERVGQSFLIKDEVKRLVHFRHLNLLGPVHDELWQELSALDAIFCRNVLIYFTPQTADEMLRRLAGALKISGQLFLGHAETLLQHDSTLELRHQGKGFFYLKSEPRKRQAAPPSATAPPAPRPLPAAPPPATAPRKGFSFPPSAAPPPPLTPAPPLEAARELFDQEDFDRAQELLDRILREEPANASALVLVAFIQAGKGALQQALETCNRVLELNDLLPEAYFLKGVILDADDRLAEAADEYRKALLLEHDFVMPRYHMGRLHLRQGRQAEAAREIRNSIRILARHDGNDTVPFSGGLTRAVCMMQLQNALAQVA